jgi:hypothetical protein
VFTDFGARMGMFFAQQPRRGTDLPGRAVTALEGVALDEGGLERMQIGAVRKTLDGGDLRAVTGDRKHQTGIYPLAVDQYGTCAALALIASLFRSRALQLLAQQVQQGDPWLHVKFVPDLVDGYGYRHFAIGC